MEIMILMIVLLFIEGLAVGQSTESKGFTGDSVLLPCNCSDMPKQLIWQNGDRVVSLYPQNTDDSSSIDKSYINRTQLFLDIEKSNCSLLLRDVSVEDSGMYTCHILTNVDRKLKLRSRKSSDVNLTVSEQKLPNQQQTGEGTKTAVHFGIPVLVVLVILAAGLLLTHLYRRQRHDQNIIYTQTSPCNV